MTSYREFFKKSVLFVMTSVAVLWFFGPLKANAHEGEKSSVNLSEGERAVIHRSLQVELPNQKHNVIKTSWPGIGCWFWSAEEFTPDGYKRFIDLYVKHSSIKLLTTSIRYNAEVTDPKVHDQIKAAAGYAREHDMAMVMDLDVRLARQAFQDKHPDELQEIVRLREATMTGSEETSITIEPINPGDHYTFASRDYASVAARVLRVYSYTGSDKGNDPESVEDITSRCKVLQADARGIRVVIPFMAEDRGRTACVLSAFTLFTPDVFAPHLIEFEQKILQQYADVPLAGACKDEWGFPGRFGPRTDDLYFSRFMAEAYAKRRPGCDLIRDLLLMAKGEKGRESQRAAAINHYMEMNWQRNGELETAFYHSIKTVFGKDAMSATHPTWFPYPNREEIFKNGLDWWAVKRDLAQTDEATPFAVRTALAKKWHSPLWYNMYYEGSVKPYEEDLWRHALGGGRINYHPIWPYPWEQLTTSLLSDRLFAAEARVELLNYISTAPIDCPVAVVFGHSAALNWSNPGFADVGMAVVDRLWAEGYYADLIPSSEITEGNLKLSNDGYIQYGCQKYAAVVFYHPQYERPAVADLFKVAATKGKTALFSVGEWTMDFDGRAFAGEAALPSSMKLTDASVVSDRVIERLNTEGYKPYTLCTMHSSCGFPASMMPKPSGQYRLLDGTVILASGEHDVMGDPIRKTIQVDGHEVSFNAVGVAAVRLASNGKLEALAAGALKSFYGGGLAIELPEPVDIALWRDKKGRWQGIIQGWEGPIPSSLSAITKNWLRLAVPKPYRP